MIQVLEVLRRWLRGDGGVRVIAQGAGGDRKTAQRYIDAGLELGLTRSGGDEQLTDEFIGRVREVVRPSRAGEHGSSWELLTTHEEQIKQWIDDDLTVAKIGDLLVRRGVKVPDRTLQRFCSEKFTKPRNNTVRVADGEPGQELQTDFGRMGMLFDPYTNRRRVVHALIVVAVWSRHMSAWTFFEGVFAILIPDNLSPVVTKADPTNPRFNDTFLEYSQDRGFLIDAARIRHPKDKPRVERQVPYVRRRFFAGETFVDLPDAQRRAEAWCRDDAGMRMHGTTRWRPAEAFKANEQGLLLPAPLLPYDVPIFAAPKVHRDRHVEVARGIYSVPGELVGQTLSARADATCVKLYAKGQLVKVHPRVSAGKRHTDPADLPSERSVYAMRDVNQLIKMAHHHGDVIGAYAEAVLDNPLPWTKMRQVYRLLGLVKKWGANTVELACAKALEAEAIDVNLIARMIERATEALEHDTPPAPNVIQGRFSRDPSEFSSAKEVGK